jgi:hypothetical protein
VVLAEPVVLAQAQEAQLVVLAELVVLVQQVALVQVTQQVAQLPVALVQALVRLTQLQP